MNEIGISLDLKNHSGNNEIEILLQNIPEENLLFKYFIGEDGIWQSLGEFSPSSVMNWYPKREGKYVIMVQAKKFDSKKPFDYISRIDCIVGNKEKQKEKLIKNVLINKKVASIGEKIKIKVEGHEKKLLYKYWIKEDEKWILLKDYSGVDTFVYTIKNPGKQEILVECKKEGSMEEYEDFKRITFEAQKPQKLEIVNFKCVSNELLTYNDLKFEVKVNTPEDRLVFYKFVKVNEDGNQILLKDYSIENEIIYTETEPGNYKILCMAKDMHSEDSFDDRALLSFKVKPYFDASIRKLTVNMEKIHRAFDPIEIVVDAIARENILYKYEISGADSFESNFVKTANFNWTPTKDGTYKINVLVKSEKNIYTEYEDIKSETVEIEKPLEKVEIQEILIDKNENEYLKNTNINIKVIATGGENLVYAFSIYKDGERIEATQYGSTNFIGFKPKHVGRYEMDIMVKSHASMDTYDEHRIINFNVREYIPAEIDYILLPIKEYIVGESVQFEVITKRTTETKIKYILRLNGQRLTETDYIENKKYEFQPKTAGTYLVELYARNVKSDKEFDSKKVIKIKVEEDVPVVNTKIKADKETIRKNEFVEFTATSNGGKEVCYEFYIMEKKEWRLVQKYSRKNTYAFSPIEKGKYKILVLSQSEKKRTFYEDFDILEFLVED